MPRIVVTGLGAVTPIGNDAETFWQNLTAGARGAGPITRFDTSEFPVRIAAEVKALDVAGLVGPKVERRFGRAAQLALVAARQASDDARLVIGSGDAARVGVVLNSGFADAGEIAAGVRTLDSSGPRSIGPFLVPTIMPNVLSCLVSIEVGAKGPVMTSTAACASGTLALLQALHLLQRGEADVVLAGASEALPGPVLFAAFERMGVLSHHDGGPSEASRPFDADRDGFVCGEGAVVLVLETEEHARRRHARVYAELAGGQLTADAHHIAAPDPGGTGAARAMEGALLASAMRPDEVDVVFAHGSGTRINDVVETRAIRAVFGPHAQRLAVSATKSMVGHTLGSAGALSALAAVLTISRGMVPPTINRDTPDPECDLDYVPGVARSRPVQAAMVNAFGFGGQNAVVVLKRYDGAGEEDRTLGAAGPSTAAPAGPDSTAAPRNYGGSACRPAAGPGTEATPQERQTIWKAQT